MSKQFKNVFVAAYGRSAVAKSGKKGALRNLHPAEMAGLVMDGVLKKLPALKRGEIDDIIVGCAIPEKAQGCNMARLIAERAGVPRSVPDMTVTRFCSSGITTIDIAAAMIEAGQDDCIVAGGVESMSFVPAGSTTLPDECSPWILKNAPELYLPMGITAENVAAKCGVSRPEMDALAVESHRRAAAAQAAGKFDDEIIPLPGVDADGNAIVFDKDQGIRRDTTLESVSSLKPAFKEDGVVTAATSSQTSDGAAFVVLMSGEKIKQLNIKPLARFIGFAVAGCEPAYMGLGPIYAVPKVMKLTGLSVQDMDVIELNEAFAAQAIPCIKELKLDPKKVNPNGGAMALGHAMGATGAVLTCKALSELRRTGGKYALITMCIGGGQGAAGIYELLK
jgi:acetyl-CoA acyltransferase